MASLYTVRCMEYKSSADAVCGQSYVCGKKAFHAQTNACPSCGSIKAQWIAPARHMKKDETDQ